MSLEQDKNKSTRVGQTIKVETTAEDDALPESIEGGTDSVSDRDESLSARESRSFKFAVFAFLTLMLSLLIYDLVDTLIAIWSVHWLAGSAVLIFFTLLIVVTVRGVYTWLWGGRSLKKLHGIQNALASVSEEGKRATGDELVARLADYYSETHLADRFEGAFSSMPDYLDGAEKLAHLDRTFLYALDEEAEKLIRKHSVQTGIAVAVSPLPALDLLLTLWRNLIMVTEIAAIYGVRPSFVNRFKILYSVMKHLAYVGLTEVSLDSFDLTDMPFLKLGGRATQGLGSAVATVRIGLEARRVCRPIPEGTRAKGMLGELVKTVAFLFGKRYTAI